MPATGSNFDTAETIAALPEIVELNIGHFLIGEAVFVGLAEACANDARRDGSRPRAGRERMILGIGSDLIDIRRIATVIERHGERFLGRIFTDVERAQAERRAKTASRPTPSALPPRRPAPRRSAPACAPACSGATWAWSICRRAGRPCS